MDNKTSEIALELNQDPEILLGAYLVAHLTQRCENCGEVRTPQWRKGWFSSVLNRPVVLCNACGLKYAKQQYCPYCMYVYYKEEDKKNQKNTWMSCSKCSRWVHIFCEQKYGTQGCTNPKEYLCPTCRNPSATPENVDHQMPTSVVMHEAEMLANALLSSPPEHQVISLVSPDAMMQ